MALCACSGGDDPDVSPVPEQVPVVLDAGIPVASRAVIENRRVSGLFGSGDLVHHGRRHRVRLGTRGDTLRGAAL